MITWSTYAEMKLNQFHGACGFRAFGENYFVHFINLIATCRLTPLQSLTLSHTLRAHVFFNSIASGDTIFSVFKYTSQRQLHIRRSQIATLYSGDDAGDHHIEAKEKKAEINLLPMFIRFHRFIISMCVVELFLVRICDRCVYALCLGNSNNNCTEFQLHQ